MENTSKESLKLRWEKLVRELSDKFSQGEDLDLDGILFLVGLQEAGLGYRRYKKDDKVNLIHVAICRLLEPYGYYSFEGVDKDGWPHFSATEKLPFLKPGQQSVLMKEAIVEYFQESGFFDQQPES